MEHIHIERDGAVGILTIARRDRFNSLDVSTARDFRKAGLQLARDRAVRAVIVRGAGGVFCSGADLRYIHAGGEPGELDYLVAGAPARAGGHGPVFKQILEYIHSAISEIRRAPKPFIAAIDGPAAAGGLGIAMACDLAIASERSWLEWAYGKTGLTGAESATFMLPRLVGFRRAMDIVLRSPRIGAREALELGLVNEVVADEALDERALALGAQLAAMSAEAMAVGKRLLNQAVGMERLDVHLDQELEALVRSADGDDVAEGIAAFFDKRPPRFGGE